MSLRKRSYLAEAKKIKWGFDLTDFGSAANWKKIVDRFKLKMRVKTKKYDIPGQEKPTVIKHFHWTVPGLMIITAANPLTGEHGAYFNRTPDKGYAGYIGIEGDKDKVMRLVKAIRKYSTDESPNRRDFI